MAHPRLQSAGEGRADPRGLQRAVGTGAERPQGTAEPGAAAVRGAAHREPTGGRAESEAVTVFKGLRLGLGKGRGLTVGQQGGLRGPCAERSKWGKTGALWFRLRVGSRERTK